MLDLYAGSGSLGLEALSRGAKLSDLRRERPRRDPEARAEHRDHRLRDRSEVLWADVKATLGTSRHDRIDLVFLDPPYNLSGSGPPTSKPS